MTALRRQAPALFLVAVLVLLTPAMMGSAFWTDSSVLIAIMALLALSAGMSYGHAGISSVATAGFASIGAFATTIVSVRLHWSPWIGFGCAVLLPPLLAYPLARMVTRLSHLALSLTTFALSGALEVAIREGGDLTGGYVGVSGIPPIPGFASPLAMHLLAWACVVAAVALYANLLDSAFGRAVGTARHDPLRATADGVPVDAVLALFFALTASVAGCAGWLYAHYVSYLGPDSLTTQTSITVLLMAVVGGAQSVLGPVLGAVLLMLLTNYLPAAETQGMVFGATLVLVMLVAPRGLAGLAAPLLGRLRPSVRCSRVLAEVRP